MLPSAAISAKDRTQLVGIINDLGIQNEGLKSRNRNLNKVVNAQLLQAAKFKTTIQALNSTVEKLSNEDHVECGVPPTQPPAPIVTERLKAEIDHLKHEGRARQEQEARLESTIHAMASTIKKHLEWQSVQQEAIGHLQQALDVARNSVNSQEEPAHAGQPANMPGPGPMPTSNASGGLTQRPGNTGRTFDGATTGYNGKRNIKSWTKWSKSTLEDRLNPEQLSLVIAELFLETSTASSNGLAAWINKVYKNSRSTPDDFDVLLPPGYLASKITKAQTEFAENIQDHWSVNKCLGVKYNNTLSREKYNRLMKELSHEFIDGHWIQKIFNGVKFPKLQSRYCLDKQVEAIKKKTKLSAWANGMGVKVDMRERIRV